ncbi:MAG: DUF4132 domain-containing protein, partial [Bacteroidota bacterium]
PVDLPLTPGAVWADAAIAEIRSLSASEHAAWARLLFHGMQASGSAPRARWSTAAETHVQVIGASQLYEKLLRWFPLVDQPRAGLLHPYLEGEVPLPINADILKGLAWLCAKSDDLEMARALTALAISAYRRIPMSGPRAVKVGNACFQALGSMPGPEGAAQLSILKTRIKGTSVQRAIGAALAAVAEREGISGEELEEMLAPTYGLQEVGFRRDEYGEVACELRIEGSELEQRWIAADGKVLASPPRAVKEAYPEELREAGTVVKEIRNMLAAQRERIDQLYLKQKKWDFSAWTARYLDHPLVGTIARRLIWKFSRGDRAASGIWLDGKIVARDGRPLDWLDGSTRVELWHPIDARPETVLEWRQWLEEHELRQPFKQAHREIYLLTDAERQTRVYSNRYAAHILRQHQFNSLCARRGWKNSLRLMVDDEFPPAAKMLPEWGLRAEYWVEGIGDHYGADTNEAGTFLYLTTDQVRFYRAGAAENRAHAAGGGYAAGRRGAQEQTEPVPLEDIPALVFSEIMRDVDMFVGVASVGNDPAWLDGGADVRYRDYWHGFSFGELGESAKTRRTALAGLLPRLKIAERCRLTEKFLIVRGDIRTYKIHLGSGNILMEPNDQYLCIVPSRGSARVPGERLFVPFEGDQTLALILSKAFLLAEDRKITDPAITRQLKR